MTRVFISYAHEDIDSARKLYEKLKSVPSIEPWFDKECLLPGVRWRPAIRKAIRESRFFVALLSHHSVTKKGFVQKELNDALEILDEFPENHIFLIPARLEECTLPFEKLREIQYVDFFPDWDKGFKNVLKVVGTARNGEVEKSAASSGYEYRCGIIDLDTGLTNIPRIAQRLNGIQHFFNFTCPNLFLPSKDAIRYINGSKNLMVNLLPQSLYEQMQYLNVDFVICITQYPLAFEDGSHIKYNYFSGPSRVDERFMFISTHLLYDFTRKANCTFEKGIAYIMLSQLVVYFSDIGYHYKTRGCLMDFCRLRSDMVKGLTEMSLCGNCSTRIKNKRLKKTIDAVLSDKMLI